MSERATGLLIMEVLLKDDTMFSLVCMYVLYVGKSDEETLEELSSRATSRMTSGASHRSRAPTSMGMATIQENTGTMSSVMPGTQPMDVLVAKI